MLCNSDNLVFETPVANFRQNFRHSCSSCVCQFQISCHLIMIVLRRTWSKLWINVAGVGGVEFRDMTSECTSFPRNWAMNSAKHGQDCTGLISWKPRTRPTAVWSFCHQSRSHTLTCLYFYPLWSQFPQVVHLTATPPSTQLSVSFSFRIFGTTTPYSPIIHAFRFPFPPSSSTPSPKFTHSFLTSAWPDDD